MESHTGRQGIIDLSGQNTLSSSFFSSDYLIVKVSSVYYTPHFFNTLEFLKHDYFLEHTMANY